MGKYIKSLSPIRKRISLSSVPKIRIERDRPFARHIDTYRHKDREKIFLSEIYTPRIYRSKGKKQGKRSLPLSKESFFSQLQPSIFTPPIDCYNFFITFVGFIQSLKDFHLLICKPRCFRNKQKDNEILQYQREGRKSHFARSRSERFGI
ncbi:MAG: hypothetical protein IK005_05400 [Paludibacteraceae bacterium]|nr:hypothetical protein [Paludibacteraceae bacterium]